ncbi:MAG TPA: MmcQ/YjbR family DNA-binding protein [Candidatus Dormibacteraeota bacterium]|nr:MmcQ/YjbR family DNA-binding protein [Candidatus Dormibacteraeota bacterium]
MDAEWLRKLCLSFPGTTEQIQWGCDLLFKVGGKMYAITPLEPAPMCLSFKSSPEKFAELTERQNIVPAPYLARAQWVALQTRDALGQEELAALLRESYEMILAKLPKKTREAISNQGNATRDGNQKPSTRKTQQKKRQKKEATKKRKVRAGWSKKKQIPRFARR